MQNIMDIQPLESKGVQILEKFDQNDPKNMGRPFYFELDHFIRTIEMMICSDEIETALWMLDHPPAWYRDNYPEELTNIKNTLFRQMYDSYEYSSESAIEPGFTKQKAIEMGKSGYFYPRMEILSSSIKKLNDSGHKPWLCEFSPSHGAMALSMLDQGLEFNYYAQNLNHHATALLKEWLPEGVWKRYPDEHQTTFFVFFEAIEHVYREEDLKQSYYKIGVDFDEIYLSTPYGCLGGGLPNWKTRQLGHVRGYTQRDFISLADKFFPKRSWELTVTHSMVLVGRKL